MSGLRCMVELQGFKTKKRFYVDLNAHCASVLERCTGQGCAGFLPCMDLVCGSSNGLYDGDVFARQTLHCVVAEILQRKQSSMNLMSLQYMDKRNTSYAV